MTLAPQTIPVGALVQLRRRRWLVQGVTPPPRIGDATLVELACAEDDAQGEPLTVLWEHEPGAALLEAEAWDRIGDRGFDAPELFAAYYRTMRWNAVTATDPSLFQAPFRAGIKIDAYQLEPLRKALALPRVNLFIADDVGLGKTIEAGLIARELLLRRRIDMIVVAAPPSMLLQWQDELEARFGLGFVILDRAYIADVRRERGYAVNPWTTHSRFLVSQRLLIDEAYTAGLRDHLGDFRPRSLLILDEAHHAAPASGARYAIDSQITRAIRGLADRFEHRLFLSATPHNGHSNSFSALLELLDPQRFVRGVNVRRGDLEAVMIRRLKDDIRELEGGFPRRVVEQVDIDGLRADAPELLLAERFDELRALREERLAGATATQQRHAQLVIGTLQQRLLSSVEAFARTLKVHKRSLERLLDEPPKGRRGRVRAASRHLAPVEADDERASLDDETLGRLGDEAMEAATAAAEADAPAKQIRRELALIAEIEALADQHRDAPDARVIRILEWIDAQMCPGVLGKRSAGPQRPVWSDRRLLIFTEWEDTRRYLQRRLEAAIDHTDRAADRIATFTGSTPPDQREALKRAFNTDPKSHPLRILIATDAAREGLNLQRHCRDLFHFDLPWNPSRLEQRNGRIDRKLQPAAEVFCRYFFYAQRPEDRVLQALVRKSETIRRDLGSMTQVLEGRVATLLERGIRRADADRQARDIGGIDDTEREAAIREELEESRTRQADLKQDIDRLRRLVERSARQIGFETAQLREAISVSLGLAGAAPIAEETKGSRERPDLYRFPAEDSRLKSDPGWAPALDLLREPRERGETEWQWRKRAAIRPVSFADTGALGDAAVHLHLEHRLVQRLLSRFASQGLVHHDLSRACLVTGQAGDPRVVLLGRLALYGPRAARLHEEIVPVTARWSDPEIRKSPLRPYAEAGEERSLHLLEDALSAPGRPLAETVRKQLLAAVPRDIAELLPHLEARGKEAQQAAEKKLALRAKAESDTMAKLLDEQRKRILAAAGTYDDRQGKLAFADDPKDVQRQREADRRAWARRLDRIDGERRTEPERIAAGYAVQAARIEPVGLVYLWPATG